LEPKSEKRSFYSEDVRSTGSVLTKPVNVSDNREFLDIRFSISCKYLPPGYDQKKDQDDPTFYTHVREISVRGRTTHSLPMNVLTGLRQGMFVTVHGKIGGEHTEGGHKMIIIADEVTSNWRFNTWARSTETPLRQGSTSDAAAESKPRIMPRKRRLAEQGSAEETTSSERRRAAASRGDSSTGRTLRSPRFESSSDKPKVEVRGDDDPRIKIFEEE